MTTAPPTDRGFRAAVVTALGWPLILLARAYQWTLSPLIRVVFGPCCRFHPSCSEYFILAVKKHGPVVGPVKGLWRVCRCHPWNPGGYDPP
jgi:hypothetical protein